MANTYSPASLGIKPPSGGFQQGGWYNGRQYWGGTLSDPGVIHPSSSQQGAGQLVSPEVNAQSAAAQGVSAQQLEGYLQQQRQKSSAVTPTASYLPGLGQVAGQAGNGSGVPGGFSQPATIDINKIYEDAYATSGIKDLETELNTRRSELTGAIGKNNDNPFLSEASRVGREEKINQIAERRISNLQNEIAMKKADVETKLNLAMKQFDINSTAAKQALDQFNTLLSIGALDGASGEDIASITRATGISSGMIQSAITKSKAKNRETQMVTSTADNGNVTATLIDTQTGEIISQQSLGKIGNAQTGRSNPTALQEKAALNSQFVSALESVKNSYGHISPQDWQGALASWVSRGGDATDFINNFKQYADPNRGDFDQVYYQR